MTASQIQTIGNALAVDLVAWGTAAIGLALVAAGATLCTARSALAFERQHKQNFARLDMLAFRNFNLRYTSRLRSQ